MIAPISSAFLYSTYGVSLDVNIISCPVIPTFSHKINSAKEEQSAPTPSFCNKRMIYGFGVALTAKYCLNPLFQENALMKDFIFSIIPSSS